MQNIIFQSSKLISKMWYWRLSTNTSWSVGLVIQEEALDVARSAPRRNHYCVTYLLRVWPAPPRLSCICGDIHCGWMEPTSPQNGICTPRLLHRLAQACPVCEHRTVRSNHPPPFFGFTLGDATAMQGIGVWLAEVWWPHRHLLDSRSTFWYLCGGHPSPCDARNSSQLNVYRVTTCR